MHLGQSVPRVEDDGLLKGVTRFGADLPKTVDTASAAVLRSPYPHALIQRIDAAAAEALPGVFGVLTRDDVKAWSKPFLVGVRQPMEHWSLAIERVRYAGEPVAVVIARDRYVAEDALELIEVEYEALDSVAEIEAAMSDDAPLLHGEVGSNVVHDREFSYGQPEEAFAAAPHRLSVTTHFPRSMCTPIETFVVDAHYDVEEASYTVRSNFQGPFSLHAVMSR
ncbi:MAG: molybdopterin-dependent oxidoreductase, partial [Gammaproteobacteria bacterium]|nr:molybdopterin-dependent oxidoreductase [Gammaproteobacteria bacterium]